MLGRISARRNGSQESKMTTSEPILFCWSGGKDSAMALHTLLQQKDVCVTALLTTVTEGYERISMHGVRPELLAEQAKSIGLPLHEVRIPPQSVNAIYEARMEAALRIYYQEGVQTVAFGDIFLEDLLRKESGAHRHEGPFFLSGNKIRANSSAGFIPSAFAPLPCASTPRCLMTASPAANSTNLFSTIFRLTRIPAAKTASSTLLFLTARSLASRFPFAGARSSSAIGLFFAI